MTEAFRREFKSFDSERVLKAWDGLIKNQQALLESLGVPAMYPTTVQAEQQVNPHASCTSLTHPCMQVQQRIMTVLAGIVESEST